MRVVFVCSGNTCRSPLAVAAWQAISRDSQGRLQGIEVTSAGLAASPGANASRHSLMVAREWGVDLSNHCAQQFTAEHAESDLIIAMTGDHAQALRKYFDTREHQVRLLASYTPPNVTESDESKLDPLWDGPQRGDGFFTPLDTDILDPYGGSLEAYQACAAQIHRCVGQLARELSNRKS